MSKGFILIIILIVIGIILVVLIKKITEVRINEYIKIPSFSRDQNLDINIYTFSLTSQSNDYVYRMEIKNNLDENVKINLNSKLIIDLSQRTLEISSYSLNDNLEPKKRKSYDIKFENIFDNSKISGINFCDKESKKWYEIWKSELECAKDKACSEGVCLENCKCYILGKEKILKNGENRNLYCIGNVMIENEIEYSSKLKGIVEIKNGEEESRKKVPIYAPFDTYIFISPVPYNNLLPLEISFEFNFWPSKGEKLRIKKINVTLLESYIEVSSFFDYRKEKVESQNCVIEIDKEIEGKVYSKNFDKYCRFNPPKIEITKKDKIEIVDTNEKAKEIVERICKDKNIEECSKDLKSKVYSLCSLYNNLEICKSSEYKLNAYKFLVEIEFEIVQKYRRSIDVRVC